MLAGRFFAGGPRPCIDSLIKLTTLPSLPGFSIGGLATMAPLYQSEIAHPSQRGRLMSTFQFFIGVGAVVAGWIAYGAAQGKHFGTALQWRESWNGVGNDACVDEDGRRPSARVSEWVLRAV